MLTKSKLNKPTIYTESDQILKDLSTELEELKSRMNQLEEKQGQNRLLTEQLAIQRNLANELIDSHQEEIEHNRDNYAAIANVMHNLKSPVADVVNNLGDIIQEIDDEDTKDTLKECMNTASCVLDAFTLVEDFCSDIKEKLNETQQVVKIRDFFKDTISQINAGFHSPHKLRLLVEKNVPESTPLDTPFIEQALIILIKELQHLLQASNITVVISQEKSDKRYGIELSSLVIGIENEISTKLQWQESWVDSIQSNQDVLSDSGFALLKIKNYLKKISGVMEVKTKHNELHGFKLKVPLNC